mmetsp:Transcript_14672/g.26287  ORF Transcript_14672/g.26287 Transcript_14672/m.26287 type:complete len:97 (-) Transcript_14672:35-325(-)
MPAVENATRSLLVRGARRYGPRTSKHGNKRYNRGRGAWKGGFLTTTARFVPVESKKIFIQVPELEGFDLKPYVARTTPLVKTAPPSMELPEFLRKE